MTYEELIRCKEFLDYLGISYTGNTIYLTDGGNSIVANPKTEWKEFLGCSINSIAEAVAKELNKKAVYID
jgi:hypothetical protein